MTRRSVFGLFVVFVGLILTVSGCSPVGAKSGNGSPARGSTRVDKVVPTSPPTLPNSSDTARRLLDKWGSFEVVALTVSNPATGRSRTTPANDGTKSLLAVLATAEWVADMRQDVTVSGDGYLVLVALKSGETIKLHYWPGESSPNIRDLGGKDWWLVKGLDSAIQPILPPE